MPDPPPAVVRTDPADGEAGVANDVVLSITFSEPMDPLATGAAYDSDTVGLRPGEVTLSWSADGATLFVTPNEPLPYASGSSAEATAPLGFAFTVEADARDLSGAPLAAPFTASFTTLRSITERLTCDPSGSAGPGGAQSTATLQAGSPFGGQAVAAYLGYTLPSAPPTEFAATLHVEVESEVGVPYSAFAVEQDGAPVTDQLDRIASDTAVEAVEGAESLAVVTRSMFTESGGRTAEIDVSAVVAEAWTGPSADLWFRISFPAAPNGQDALSWYSPCTEDGATRLAVNSLVP